MSFRRYAMELFVLLTPCLPAMCHIGAYAPPPPAPVISTLSVIVWAVMLYIAVASTKNISDILFISGKFVKKHYLGYKISAEFKKIHLKCKIFAENISF